MDDTLEYLYLGEPHTDDYEGDVRLDEITLLLPDGGQSVPGDRTKVSKGFRLTRNFPNPFNARTVISYTLTEASPVKIEIYDILGRKIVMLCDEIQPAGYNQIIWDADSQPSGIYFYKIVVDGYSQVKTMLLLK